MRIRAAMTGTTTLLLSTALGGVSSAEGIDPSLPNLVPMFPDPSRVPNNFVITNRLGPPTIEFEILTSNIGGQDWIRPPINRDVACTSSTQYYRMPQIHEYTVYRFDPDLQDWTMVDQRRAQTICFQDDGSLGRDPQTYCLHEHEDTRFPCGCSGYYGPGRGNGVSRGFSDRLFRGLAGQWAALGPNLGDSS